MYDYLVENYGECTQLENGGYYAVNKYGDEIYVPPECSSEVGIVAYYPGVDGSDICGQPLRDQINSDNPPPYIVTISHDANDKSNILETATEIANANDISVSKVVPVTFSLSGGIGFEKTEEYLENHPDVDCAMISADGWCIEDYVTQNPKANVDTMIDRQVPVIMIGPGTSRVGNITDDLAEMGFNVYRIDTERGGHSEINRDMINNGVIDYVMGVTDSISDDPDNRGRKCNYVGYKYNPETGDMEVVELDEISGEYYVYNANVDKYTKSDKFEIEVVESEVKNKYGSLQNLDELRINCSADGDNVVMSDMQYVSDSMNQIRGQVKNASFLKSLNTQQFRSSSGIPGCIGAIIGAYFDAVGSLLSSISSQTEAVVSVGQALADMDKDLSNRVDEIGSNNDIAPGGKIVAVPSKETTPSDSGGGGSVSNGTPAKSNAPRNDGSKTNKPPQNGNNGSGGGSNKEASKPDGNGNDNANRGIGDNNFEKPKEPSDDDIKYVIDDGPNLNKIRKHETYEYEDGHEMLVETQGNTVVDVKYEWNYDSPEEAALQYQELTEKYKDLDMVDNVIWSGNKIEVTFKKDAYANMTKDEILEKYYNGGNTNGSNI